MPPLAMDLKHDTASSEDNERDGRGYAKRDGSHSAVRRLEAFFGVVVPPLLKYLPNHNPCDTPDGCVRNTAANFKIGENIPAIRPPIGQQERTSNKWFEMAQLQSAHRRC